MKDEKTEPLEHSYDGVQEYDNPLPGWWVWIFVATIAWSVLYVIDVPVLGRGKGRIADYEREMKAWHARQAAEASRNPLANATDESLRAALDDSDVRALGKTTFAANCFACHGADGGGGIGPNLTDEYWLHGARPTEVLHTVSNGVVEKGMPAWSQTMKPEQVRAVAVHVLSLEGTHPATPKAPQGVKVEGAED